MTRKPYSDGRIHVMAEMCPTCVFRPGNLMGLVPGRLAGMVAEAKRGDSAITCHSTLYGQSEQEAVCRGFFDRHATVPLRLAAVMDLVTWCT